MSVETERVRLSGISSRAFEHPADSAAMAALRKVPGLDLLIRKLVGLVGEKSLRFLYLGSAVRVTETQFSRLNSLYEECLEILDVRERPELFVAQTPFVNAGAAGVNRPFIVVNSGAIGLLSDEQLRFILGHELGHIICDHVLYKTMLNLLMRVGIIAMAVPLGGAALFAIMAALLEWDRKSELSADRAGLLVGQDPVLAMTVEMKLAGGGKTSEMSIDEFVKQAEEYQAAGGVIDSVIKFMNLIGRRHPFAVLRLAELKKWVDSGEYDAILAGTYPRRDGDRKASVYDEIKNSSKSYGDDFTQSKEPIAAFFRNVGSDLQEAGESFSGFLRRNMPGRGGDA